MPDDLGEAVKRARSKKLRDGLTAAATRQAAGRRATDPTFTGWKGPWDPADPYERGNVVSHGGSSWRALADHDASEPPSQMWELVARKGTDGKRGSDGIGAQGPQGPPGPEGSYPFDVTNFGAVGDGTTDDTAAIRATIAAAKASAVAPFGAMVYVPAGRYRITDALDLPTGVDLVGGGMRATLLIGAHPDARVSFEGVPATATANYGGRSGGFTFAGGDIATTGIFVGLCVARTFSEIDINHCAGDGLALQSTQNCHFEQVNSANNSGSGVHYSHGAGGNLFSKCEFNLNGYANGRSSWGGTPPAGVNDMPNLNVFVCCLFEGTLSTTVACFDHGCGVRTMLMASHLTLLSAHGADFGTDIPVFWMREETAGKLSTRASIMGGSIVGSASPTPKGIGILGENTPGTTEGPNIHMESGCTISYCTTGIQAVDGFVIDADDDRYIWKATVATRFANLAGGTATEGLVVRTRDTQQTVISKDPAAPVRVGYGTLDGTSQTGDLDQLWQNAANKRWSIDATGNAVAWNGYMRAGVGFRSDTRGLVDAPAHTFTNDLDTGMWSPGVDELALSAGGIERLRLTGGVPVVSGAHGGNAALQSLLSALVGMGLIVDSTS